MNTEFSRQFGLKLPIIVAPMAGGCSTPKLVARAGDAGVLGSLGCAYLEPDEIRALVKSTRDISTASLAINLFAPQKDPELTAEKIAKAIEATAPFRNELQLATPTLAPPFHPNFDQQFEVILDSKPAVFSFIFGLVQSEHIKACRKQRIVTMGTATNLAEATELAQSGVDCIVAQGSEAGGHRGFFSAEATDTGLNTMELTSLLVSRIRIPIIAAGGIMDGADIVRAIAHGAQAVQMGTAFLLCEESGTSPAHRKALSEAKLTQLTRVFSGRLARGIHNRFIDEMEKKTDAILPFPAQNVFTRDLRNKSAQINSPDFLSLWTGSGVEKIRKDMSVKRLVNILESEVKAATPRRR